MINWQSILSLFDQKGTLLRAMKVLTKAVEEGVLESVDIEQDSKTTMHFVFRFADGTNITTQPVDIPEGLQGPAGTDGKDGTNGTNGKDGLSIFDAAEEITEDTTQVLSDTVTVPPGYTVKVGDTLIGTNGGRMVVFTIDQNRLNGIYAGGAGGSVTIPVAGPTVIGGVQASLAVGGMEQPVGIGEDNKLYTYNNSGANENILLNADFTNPLRMDDVTETWPASVKGEFIHKWLKNTHLTISISPQGGFDITPDGVSTGYITQKFPDYIKHDMDENVVSVSIEYYDENMLVRQIAWGKAPYQFAPMDTISVISTNPDLSVDFGTDSQIYIKVKKPITLLKAKLELGKEHTPIQPLNENINRVRTLGESGGGSYTLPVANANRLGGVQTFNKTNNMTVKVGIEEDGSLWSEEEVPYYTAALAGKFLGVDENGATNWRDVPSGGVKSVTNSVSGQTLTTTVTGNDGISKSGSVQLPAGGGKLYQHHIYFDADGVASAEPDSKLQVIVDIVNTKSTPYTEESLFNYLKNSPSYLRISSNGSVWLEQNGKFEKKFDVCAIQAVNYKDKIEVMYKKDNNLNGFGYSVCVAKKIYGFSDMIVSCDYE